MRKKGKRETVREKRERESDGKSKDVKDRLKEDGGSRGDG